MAASSAAAPSAAVRAARPLGTLTALAPEGDDPTASRGWLRPVLLASGIVSSLVYVALNLIGAARYPGYSLASQTISELYAIGAVAGAGRWPRVACGARARTGRAAAAGAPGAAAARVRPGHQQPVASRGML